MLRDDIAKLCPRPSSAAKAKTWDFYVNGICDNPSLFVEYSIDTKLEWCHLIAQWAHETGGFIILWESGAYTPSGLMKIFGLGKHSARVTSEEAMRLCSLRGEERDRAIFERVYGLGNPRKAEELGNTEEGDGYAHRGFGITQITGRSDHEKYFAGDYSAENVIRSALREWSDKNCGKYAMADDCKRVTKLINGGYNGLVDRQAYLAKAKRIWSDCPDFEAMAGTEPPNDDELIEENDNVPGVVDDEPKKHIVQSKTGNTSIAVGLTGGGMTAQQMMTEFSTAVAKANADGGSVIMKLLESPTFLMTVVSAVVLVGGPIFIWWDRWRRPDIIKRERD